MFQYFTDKYTLNISVDWLSSYKLEWLNLLKFYGIQNVSEKKKCVWPKYLCLLIFSEVTFAPFSD